MSLSFEYQQPAARSFAAEEPGQRLIRVIAPRQPFRIWIVVVDADDVRGDALPPVVADHWARRIECSRQVIERLHVVTLGGVVGQVRHAPGLVDRHPRHHTRMAAIALNRRGPLARDTPDRLRGETVGTGHFDPDHQAKHIRPIEIPRVFELLMLPHAVEAHLLGQLDVSAQRVIVWGGHAAVWPVALIEDQTLSVRAVIEHEAIALSPDGAQRRVTRTLYRGDPHDRPTIRAPPE